MRIQLLNPPTLINPKTLNTSRPTPPLGLAYIAGTLRHAGHDCSVIDAIAEAPAQRLPVGQLERLGLSDAEILDRIDPQARALAIGCMFSFGWPMLRGLIHAVRARFPDMLIVCGGEHFSALTEQCMATAPIDYIVVGEGEEIAAELFAQLDSNLPFDAGTIKGIAWRRGDTVVVNPRADRMKAIDELSWPAWDLFDLEAYNAHDLVGGLSFGKVVPILATRGCPYQCTYCSSPQMWTTRWHTRRPELVADEIEHYHSRYGANNFPFQDLTMIVKRDWIISFCNEIIRRNLDIRWQLPSGTRCEVVDDEVAELLQRSGCRWLCYAPESGSERTRELIKKRMKTESLLGAVESSVRAGLHLSTFFVIGFPHDTADDMRATARLLRELARRGVEDIAVSFFFPIPSTELYTSLLQRGRVRPDDDGLMSPLFAQQPTLVDERNFCDHLSAAQLNRWKLWLAANFYVTAWATHPTRVLRIAWNALRGKQTSSMEKLLGDRIRRLVRRRAPRQVPIAASDSEARPSQAA